MTDVVKIVVAAAGGFGLAAAIGILLFLNQDKVEQWVALFWRLGSRFWKYAAKQYLKHDLQGRINDFAWLAGAEAPFMASTKVHVEWTEELKPKPFFDNDRVIIRLRRDDPNDSNFVRGAYQFIATSLLFKAKRYISPTQGLALDLFVTTRLLEKKRATLAGRFLDEYVHPAIAQKQGARELLGQFDVIYARGHFYDVLLQEFDFLGGKVFGRPHDQRVVGEVRQFIDVLETFCSRKVGEDNDMNVVGEYCRTAVMIVGRPVNVARGIGMFERYVREQLAPKQIETIYMVGLDENRTVLDGVSGSVADLYNVYRTRRYETILIYPDERSVTRGQYLVVMRRVGVSAFSTAAQR